MATQQFNAITGYSPRGVGNLVSMDKYIMDVANGAIFTEDVENYTLVELAFNATGERTAKNATANAEKLFLAASIEHRYNNEPFNAFYNGTGERGRIVYLTEGLIFDSSSYTAAAAVAAGNLSYWDVTTKKFIIITASNATYEAAEKKFKVLGMHTDLSVPAVRLEVQ